MKKIYVYLDAAMGDNLYLYAACRAIKMLTHADITLVSSPLFVPLAHACPHFSAVWQADALTMLYAPCI